MQTCIWPVWCHCHSLSLASVKSRLVLPFWYQLTRVVPDKGLLNGCVCVCFLQTDAIKASIKLTHQRAALLWYLQSCCCRCRETVSWTAAALCPAWKLSWTSLLQDRETPSKLTRRGESNSSWGRRPVVLTANRWHYMPPRFVVSETSRCSYSCYFTSSAVTVDFSHMTASSSASWSRFSPPSNFVNEHALTMWFMVCRWPQSQWRDPMCKLAQHGSWPVRKRFTRGRVWLYSKWSTPSLSCLLQYQRQTDDVPALQKLCCR